VWCCSPPRQVWGYNKSMVVWEVTPFSSFSVCRRLATTSALILTDQVRQVNALRCFESGTTIQVTPPPSADPIAHVGAAGESGCRFKSLQGPTRHLSSRSGKERFAVIDRRSPVPVLTHPVGRPNVSPELTSSLLSR
jgi:hypothetical protein